MNISDLILGDKKNEDAIEAFARNFNLENGKARDVIGELAPSLGAGLGHHAKKESGLGAILDALKTGNHSRYNKNPDLFGKQETIDDGNSILGHIFGSKEVSRNVSERAAQKTGIGSALIKKMLPVVATMVMGSLGKKILGGGRDVSRAESGGLLTRILDADNDGSMIDDVLGMAFKMAFR